MAAKKFSTGIVITDGPNETRYRGTREALIAAGVCSEEQFPIWPKRVRYRITPRWDAKGHPIPKVRHDDWSIRRLKGGIFEFWQEHERRARPRPPLRSLPEEFKESFAKFCSILVESHLRLHVLHEDTGERLKFAPESHEAILGATEALAQTIRSARVETAGRNGLEVVTPFAPPDRAWAKRNPGGEASAR
jgi:hypothetical protein